MALVALTASLSAGCGSDAPSAVRQTSSGASTTASTTASESGQNDVPVTTADRFVTAWQAGDVDTMRALSTDEAFAQAASSSPEIAASRLVDRGGVSPHQVPGTSPGCAAPAGGVGRPVQGGGRGGLDA